MVTALSETALLLSMSAVSFPAWVAATNSPALVEGYVVDGRGLPVEGVAIQVLSDEQVVHAKTVTDINGHFLLEKLDRGLFWLQASKEGFLERRKQIRITHGDQQVHLKFVLTTEAAATVEVVSQRGFINFKDLDQGGQDLAGVASSASQGIVTESRLEGRPILRPGETLETVPGVIVTQHSGGGKANQYFCRGFSLDHGTDFATIVAGMPVNLPNNAHGQGYMDLNFLIPELVSGIQYWKGSYLAEQGDFSNAGTANINYVNKLDRANLNLEIGSLGYRRALYAASVPIGNGNFLYAIEGYHYDGGWERPDDYRRANTFLRYSTGGPENGWTLSGIGYRGMWNSNHQVPQRAIHEGIIDRFGNLDPTDGGKSDRHALTLDWRRTTSSHQTRLQVYAFKYDMDLWSDFTFFLSDPAHGDQVEQVDHRWTYGFHLSESWSQDLGSVGLDNQVGLQARKDDISKVGLFHTEAQQRFGTISDDGIQQVQLAIYAQSTLRFSPHFRVTLGLREDHYAFDVTNHAEVPGGIDPIRLGGRKTANLLSPKLGLAFGPWGSTEFYFNRADGFHSNDARGIVKRQSLSGETLEPATPLVKSRAYEIGMRTRPVVAWQTSFSLWRLDMDSELVFSGDEGTTEPSRPSRRLGIEWSNDFSPWPWMNVDFDYAFSKARYTDADPVGDRIPEAIEGTGSLGISVKNGTALSANLRARYFGPRPLLETNSVRSHASTLIQVRFGWQVNAHVGLSLEAMNLLNAKVNDIEYYYATRLKNEVGSTPPEGVMDRMVHPSDPRSIRFATTWRF